MQKSLFSLGAIALSAAAFSIAGTAQGQARQTSIAGFSCGLELSGDAIRTASDGAGGFIIGIRSPEILDARGRVVRPLGYDVSTHRYNDLIFVTDTNNKVGVYDLCKDELVTKPQFDQIARYSDDGYAIAFTAEEFTALDNSGAQFLPRRFKHALPLRSFRAVPKGGWGQSWRSNNGMIPFSWDGRSWGVFDLNARSVRIDPIYDNVFPKPPEYQKVSLDDLEFTVEKAGLQSRLNISSGELLLPFVFTHIKETVSADIASEEPRYVIGYVKNSAADGDDGLNVYDLKKDELLLPDTDVYNWIDPVFKNERSAGLWAVEPARVRQQAGIRSSELSLGLYDETKREFVIPPAPKRADQIAWLKDDIYAFRRWSGDQVAIFRASDAKQLTGYGSGEEYEEIRLRNGGDDTVFRIQTAPAKNSFTIYDDDALVVLEGLTGTSAMPRIEGDLLVITERPSPKKFERRTTCLDANYRIVGARFDCNPTILSQAVTSAADPNLMPSLPCDHKMFKRKRNIAKFAELEVPSTRCDATGCYAAANMIDQDREEYRSSKESWTSADYGASWVELHWPEPYSDTEQIYFIIPRPDKMDRYTVEIETLSGWKKVAQVRGNTENKICHRFPPTEVSAVRISADGEQGRRYLMSVNEVVVR